jgi:hypothetical protein
MSVGALSALKGLRPGAVLNEELGVRGSLTAIELRRCARDRSSVVGSRARCWSPSCHGFRANGRVSNFGFRV